MRQPLVSKADTKHPNKEKKIEYFFSTHYQVLLEIEKEEKKTMKKTSQLKKKCEQNNRSQH